MDIWFPKSSAQSFSLIGTRLHRMSLDGVSKCAGSLDGGPADASPIRDLLRDAPNTGANLMNRRFNLPYQFSGAKEMPRWSNARC